MLEFGGFGVECENSSPEDDRNSKILPDGYALNEPLQEVSAMFVARGRKGVGYIRGIFHDQDCNVNAGGQP